DILDRKLIEQSQPALDNGKAVQIKTTIGNADRTTGAMLSGAIAAKYGHQGLPADTIQVKLSGIAGQSFGAFLSRGVSFTLEGEANDYVGKGLSGGRLVIHPPRESGIVPDKSIIVGNTVLYGAIAGECYFYGIAGERFAVRNSGALAVVEGTGDHACEYMTGGCVCVLGKVGRNFAAGMSGGIAYVLDEDDTFPELCNMAMVDLERIENKIETPLINLDQDMDKYDAARLHRMLTNHAHYTGSVRAKNILTDWDDYLPKFHKVMPREYRRVLAEAVAKDNAPTQKQAGE
ncbi:MAG: glutamate synthase subunit alpha, partial [Alphaproteobacteria bacterium]|nr:glutamate synthase subunit alpha [Alphaproteobacteria bacterium]